MGKKVAVTAEVTATPGTVLLEGAKSGSWTAGPIDYTSYSKLKVGGRSAIHQATCTFTFAGDASGTDVVTLTAQPKKTQRGHSSVLVDGDSKTSKYGNQLKVSAAGKLHTD
jgi:hypothetical protein